ncbi:acetyltransferase family protein [Collimonas arenae]|uniref:Acetyltransferase family protein n=1 Tax=Collimonas arenae TaxID=279058 RepID=A0A127PW78_9BURK|nr:GNAT family N-acetyltransferase [Collimonas arenae]AMP02047.1 acetyltransferase family protein [Collimonas arenae]AMP11942.1 acetyltransferase family protein [Collimonas arenae]
MATDSAIRPAATIKPLTEQDYDIWYPQWQGYQDFYQVDIPLATRKITWQRLLDPKEPMFGALAMVGEQAVGMVHWIFHRSCWTVEYSCYLQDLYVDAGQRGLGLGRLLIEHVCAQAKAAGSTRVHWLTHETNSTAMQLYDRIAQRPGFVQYRKQLD